MIRLFLMWCTFCISITFYALSAAAQNSFQLAPPLLKFNSTFFKKNATIHLLFAQPGASIHYTTNGDEPTLSDPIYTKPLIIRKNLTTLKAKAYSADFLPSTTVSATFVKDGLPFDASFPPANSKYAGEGTTTLNNNKGGIANHNLPQWLGYNDDSVTIFLSLKKEQALNSVFVNAMQNQGGWIFLPSKVEAFMVDKKNQDKWIKIGQTENNSQKNVDDLMCKSLLIPLNNTSTQQLKLVFHNQKLPQWHSGNGNNSWIFIDEIKLY